MDSHFERTCLQKRPFAERRIITDGNLAGRRASTEQRSGKLPDLHLPVQRRGKTFFQAGTETVHVDKQGRSHYQDDQDSYHNADDSKQAFHNVRNAIRKTRLRMRLTELLVCHRISAMRLWRLAVFALGLALPRSLAAQGPVASQTPADN